jgi:arylsulfatase A-like enzyme
MYLGNSFCTNSICDPSRAVIMTGKHSHKNGFMNNDNLFNWNQQTFPKLLRKQGSSIRDLREVTPQGPAAGI